MRRSVLAIPLAAVIGCGGLAFAFQASPEAQAVPQPCSTISATPSSSPSASASATTSISTSPSATTSASPSAPITSASTTASPTGGPTTVITLAADSRRGAASRTAAEASSCATQTPSPSASSTAVTSANPTSTAVRPIRLTLAKSVQTGRTLKIRVRGLASGETFTVKAASLRRSGKATRGGTAAVTLRAPKPQNLTVVVRTARTTARARVRVTAVRPQVRFAQRSIRASDSVLVRVTRLVPGEKVVASFDGHLVARGRASARGTWVFPVTAGTAWGRFDVTVASTWTTRIGRATVTVGQRCATGVHACA